MRSLLLGGSGFIGRAVARLTLAQGWPTYLADNHDVKPEDPTPRGAEYLWTDVRYASQVRAAVQWAKPEVIFSLAARQGYGADWRRFADVNVAAAWSLAEVLRDLGWAGLVVHASSQAVYAPGLQDTTESSPADPPSVYGLTKLHGERALRFFAESQEAVRVVALRPCVVLGRGQAVQSSESGVLRNWARSALAGRRPEVYGTGEHVRDFVHVEDCARAFVLAATAAPGAPPAPWDVLNVGGEPDSILGLARRFQEAWPGCPDPEVLGRDVRPGGEYTITSASVQAGMALGWRPELGLDAMIRDFVAGVQK